MVIPILPNSLASQPPWIIVFFFLGLLTVTKFCISLLYWTYAFFLRPAKDLKTTYGSWALITGSTDGIGKAIAFEFARKNLNLVLVGRNLKKLDTVSTQIQDKFKNVLIKKVVVDLSHDLLEGMKVLLQAIQGLDVGVLVNSAGVSNDTSLFLHEGAIEMWVEMLKVNLEATTMVTHALLPGMLERKRGAILNLGSGVATCFPSFPFFGVYTATKAYVAQFSKSLDLEYKNRGINVQCQVPCFVDTKMVPDLIRFNWYSIFMSPIEPYTQATVRWIGYDRECHPYLPHFIQYCLMNLVPDFLRNLFAFYVLNVSNCNQIQN